jgi:hypothetical protein
MNKSLYTALIFGLIATIGLSVAWVMPVSSSAVFSQVRRSDSLQAESDGRAWIQLQRAYPHASIPRGAYEHALAQAYRLTAGRAGASGPWQLVGPISPDTNQTPGSLAIPHVGFVTGRVTALATTPFLDKSGRYTIYAGGDDDGVWKSSDRGRTWTPTSDLPGGPGVSALAIAPTRPSPTIYAITKASSRGLVFSTDEGKTWQLKGEALAGGPANGLSVDPSAPSTLYAAMDGGNTAGLWVSHDSGATWTKKLGGSFFGGDACWYPAVDVSVGRAKGSRTATAYATIFNPGCHKTGIYKSSDRGQHWIRLTGLYKAMPRRTPDTALTALHATTVPSNPKMVYANVAGPNNATGVYESVNGGATWKRRHQCPTTWQQSCHAGQIVVDARAPATIFMLGDIELDISHNGGLSYFDTDWCACQSDDRSPLYVHADTHAMGFGPEGSVYLGGDGGVYVSTDHGDSWRSLSNNLDLNEVYGIAVSAPAQPFVVIQGVQDNGSQILGGPSHQWTAVQSGDGTYTGVDALDAKVLYAEQQGGGLIKSTDGGSTWNPIAIPAGTQQFLTYYLVDANPAFHKRLLYNESNSLYESLDAGATWHVLNNSVNMGNANYIHTSITQVAVAPSDEHTLYAAELGGQVQATTNNGVSWMSGSGLPNRVMSAVAVNPHLSSMAWATASGFGSGHVFQTTNSGATWTDRTGNLPDAPASGIVAISRGFGFKGVTLYVGTDVGVFVSTNDGRTWSPVGTAFPQSPLTALVLRSGTLYAATYGRGLWSLSAS